MSSISPQSCELVVVARNVDGQIITRITSNRNLIGALNTAQSVLRLKDEAIRVEIHHHEGIQSNYLKKPVAALDREDLLEKENR